jgi:hypothetical protein
MSKFYPDPTTATRNMVGKQEQQLQDEIIKELPDWENNDDIKLILHKYSLIVNNGCCPYCNKPYLNKNLHPKLLDSTLIEDIRKYASDIFIISHTACIPTLQYVDISKVHQKLDIDTYNNNIITYNGFVSDIAKNPILLTYIQQQPSLPYNTNDYTYSVRANRQNVDTLIQFNSAKAIFTLNQIDNKINIKRLSEILNYIKKNKKEYDLLGLSSSFEKPKQTKISDDLMGLF